METVKKMGGCQGLRCERGSEAEPEPLQGYAEDTIMVNTSLQVCQNPEKITPSELMAYGLCIIAVCQGRVIRCHTVPLRWGALTLGDTVHV